MRLAQFHVGPQSEISRNCYGCVLLAEMEGGQRRANLSPSPVVLPRFATLSAGDTLAAIVQGGSVIAIAFVDSGEKTTRGALRLVTILIARQRGIIPVALTIFNNAV